jgi:hypothetical protein
MAWRQSADMHHGRIQPARAMNFGGLLGLRGFHGRNMVPQVEAASWIVGRKVITPAITRRQVDEERRRSLYFSECHVDKREVLMFFSLSAGVPLGF